MKTTTLLSMLSPFLAASNKQSLVVRAFRTSNASNARPRPSLQRPRHSAKNSRSFHSSTARMCQLLGMNGKTDTSFSFWPGFCERGGGTDIHAHGWGLAYYPTASSSSLSASSTSSSARPQRIRQYHDTLPAARSPLARSLATQQLATRNLLAHIRYATSGDTNSAANVHPFCREMWGLSWSFCHNGQIPWFDEQPEAQLEENVERVYVPTGNTDSERAFCAILNVLRARFTDVMPSLPVLYDTLQSLCRAIVAHDPEHTILNFLLACGPHTLWAYSHPGRRPGSKTWNGLYYSVREAAQARQQHLHDGLCGTGGMQLDLTMPHNNTLDQSCSSDNQQVCVVATKPLTDQADEWVEIERDQLLVFDNGVPFAAAPDLFRIELQGRGLYHGCQEAMMPDYNTFDHGLVMRPPALEEDMRRYAVNPQFFVGNGI